MANRRLISSGSAFEARIGYSRAVVDGDWVFVSGTTGFDYAAMTIADDVVAQAEQCLRNIGWALEQAGASFADVVRVRYISPEPADFEPCWPVLRGAFADVWPRSPKYRIASSAPGPISDQQPIQKSRPLRGLAANSIARLNPSKLPNRRDPTERWDGRVIGVQRERDPNLLGDRDDRAHKIRVIPPHLVRYVEVRHDGWPLAHGRNPVDADRLQPSLLRPRHHGPPEPSTRAGHHDPHRFHTPLLMPRRTV